MTIHTKSLSALGCALLLSTTALAAPVTQTRDVPSFTKIAINGSIDADITVGPKRSVAITADAEDQDRIKTEVRGDTLVIRMKGRFQHSGDMQATIQVPKLEGIDINGSSDAVIAGIDSEDFEININGSGDVSAQGRCDEAEYEINGSGDISAFDLVCNDIDVEINGSGDTDVYAEKSIQISISGSGDVTAKGSPKVKHMRSSGSGSFQMKD
ncbi:hypothetical protein JCM17844_09310 [Iodidimonas gelatinilytica]|uniref:Putative auto-transporter adhesin head GIN domain-containing protein n=1 Tax=Iodidimonas gelatinilytica TaxID=1236966 RepID=A0A5A7MNT2_9PROT|nr:head GIN domain-containing protein [Iodidimonas gelatinilytica]GEQ97294.1 hypothetical protein JCM17844_09310 [Iodidimonas gelatinilytica]